MTVRWTPTGLRDLESLHAYLAEDNEDAAAAMVDKIIAGVEALQRYPQMGRKGRVAGTRELVIYPFVVAYKVKSSAIEVIAVIHGARRWPDSF
jgi:toxin ParE1/3/4